MKNSLKIAVLFIALLCSSQAEAQFFKKLQKKIENKIERKLEKKADEKAEQALDSVFVDRPSKRKKSKQKEKNPKDNSTEMDDFNLGEMMEAVMNRKPVEISDSYNFDITVTMEVATSGNNPMVMKTSYGDGAHYIEMGNGMTIISDYKNEAMITLDEDKKTAQAMSLGLLKKFENSEIEANTTDLEDIQIKRTGKTKTISGYRCEQYIIKGTDFNTEGWFTKEINFDMLAHSKSMPEMFKTSSSQAMMQGDIGFPMEMTSTTNKNEKVIMKVLEISEKSKIIDLTEYAVSQL